MLGSLFFEGGSSSERGKNKVGAELPNSTRQFSFLGWHAVSQEKKDIRKVRVPLCLPPEVYTVGELDLVVWPNNMLSTESVLFGFFLGTKTARRVCTKMNL